MNNKISKVLVIEKRLQLLVIEKRLQLFVALKIFIINVLKHKYRVGNLDEGYAHQHVTLPIF